MQDTVKPKVTVNEDYLDLRNYKGTSECMSKKTSSKNSPRPKRSSPVRAFSLQNEGVRHEKDPNYSRLIHCGLRNLVTTYNATAGSYQKQNLSKRKQCLSENSQTDPRYQRFLVKLNENQSLKSKSDISMIGRKISLHQVSSSTPAFRNQKPIEKIEPLKNKSTMTKTDDKINKIVIPRANHNRSRSKDFHIKHATNCVVNTPYENGLRSKENIKRCVDPRLTEKYSILKVPSWKRSWTIPVFSRKQGLANYNYNDNFDRQTYLFDDGSEVDSMYIDKRPAFMKKLFPKECLVILFVMGAACGILLASLLIYIIFGNELLHAFFKPRESLDPSVKSYVKYIGGGVIYVITRFFRVLGDILSIPSQEMKEPHNPFQWHTDNR